MQYAQAANRRQSYPYRSDPGFRRSRKVPRPANDNMSRPANDNWQRTKNVVARTSALGMKVGRYHPAVRAYQIARALSYIIDENLMMKPEPGGQIVWPAGWVSEFTCGRAGPYEFSRTHTANCGTTALINYQVTSPYTTTVTGGRVSMVWGRRNVINSSTHQGVRQERRFISTADYNSLPVGQRDPYYAPARPAVLPRVEPEIPPWIDPLRQPILQPVPEPVPPPYWAIPHRQPNPWRSPVEQPTRGPLPRPANDNWPRPANDNEHGGGADEYYHDDPIRRRFPRHIPRGYFPPSPDPYHQIPTLPGLDRVPIEATIPSSQRPGSMGRRNPRSTLRTLLRPHYRRPPLAGDREVKGRVYNSRWYRFLLIGLSLGTEADDFIDAMYSGIDRSALQNWLRRNGIKSPSTFDKARAIKELFNYWDPWTALRQYAFDQVVDLVFGTIGRINRLASQAAGFSTGFQAGPWDSFGFRTREDVADYLNDVLSGAEPVDFFDEFIDFYVANRGNLQPSYIIGDL